MPKRKAPGRSNAMPTPSFLENSAPPPSKAHALLRSRGCCHSRSPSRQTGKPASRGPESPEEGPGGGGAQLRRCSGASHREAGGCARPPSPVAAVVDTGVPWGAGRLVAGGGCGGGGDIPLHGGLGQGTGLRRAKRTGYTGGPRKRSWRTPVSAGSRCGVGGSRGRGCSSRGVEPGDRQAEPGRGERRRLLGHGGRGKFRWAGLRAEWAGPGLAEQVWVGGACGMRRARSGRVETGQSGRIQGEVTGLSYSWTEPREEDCALPVSSACAGGWSQSRGGASGADSWGVGTGSAGVGGLWRSICWRRKEVTARRPGEKSGEDFELVSRGTLNSAS